MITADKFEVRLNNLQGIPAKRCRGFVRPVLAAKIWEEKALNPKTSTTYEAVFLPNESKIARSLD